MNQKTNLIRSHNLVERPLMLTSLCIKQESENPLHANPILINAKTHEKRYAIR